MNTRLGSHKMPPFSCIDFAWRALLLPCVKQSLAPRSGFYPYIDLATHLHASVKIIQGKVVSYDSCIERS